MRVYCFIEAHLHQFVRNMSNKDNTMKRCIILLLAVLISMSAFASASAYSQKGFVVKGARCSIPGIVKNRTSHTMMVRGDLPGDSTQRSYVLYPGQDSNRHTPLCDVDYFTVTGTHFWYTGIRYPPNRWSGYIGWSTYECKPKPSSSDVNCKKVGGAP